jgi:hypothetical protein
MPRAPMLTTQQREEFLRAIHIGTDHVAAAKYAKAPPDAVAALLERDAEFRAAVDAAEASAEMVEFSAVAQAARKGEWRAASYLLDRPRRSLAPAAICGSETLAASRTYHGGRTPPECRELAHKCRKAPGFGTSHPGSGSCKLHAGSTPNGVAHAANERAVRVLASLGLPIPKKPREALLELVCEAAGNVAFLRQQVAALGVDLTLSHTEWGALRVTIREDARAVVKLYGEWCDRLAKFSKMAHDAGIAEQDIELRKQEIDFAAGILYRACEKAGIRDEALDDLRAAFADEMRLAVAQVPVGAELN